MDENFYRKKKKLFDPADLFRKFLRNKRLVILTVVGLVIAAFAVGGKQGFYERFRLERQKEALEQEIRDAEAEYHRLQKKSRDLDSSFQEIEKAAREKFGMSRPGETVYRTTPAR